MLAAKPGCGNIAKSGGLPAFISITICCSKLSEPPYSTVAPVAFSKIAAISLMYPSSGANHGPEMVTFCPLRSGPLYAQALTLVLKNKTLTKNAKINFIVLLIFPPIIIVKKITYFLPKSQR